MTQSKPKRVDKRDTVDREAVKRVAEEAVVDAAALLAGASELPPAVVIAELGQVKLRELDGKRTALRMLWADAPAALIFLRHYGWMFCREQAAQLRGVRTSAEKLGNLVIIGQGSLEQGLDFNKTHGKGLRALVDSDREAYKVLNFQWGVFRTLGAPSLMRGLGALRKGFVQGSTQGDAFQQGGTLVLAAGGEPVFFQRSAFAGDHPEVRVVLGALAEAARP